MADALQGTWLMKDSVSLMTGANAFSVNFISKGIEYKTFTMLSNFGGSINYTDLSDSVLKVYSQKVWTDTAYKTINITSKLSEVTNGEQLLTWLQENATKQEATRKSVDLTTLAGWEALSSGTHNITIVAKANGFKDSAPSAAVQVEKAVAGFVQVFPTKTSDNYTLIENLNQSKIYSVQPRNIYPEDIAYLKYENGAWTTSNIYIFNIINQTENSVSGYTNGGDAYFEFYDSGITLEGDMEATTADFKGFSTTKVYAKFICFVEGTKITLSDGSTKPVQDIRYGDEVICYNFYTGKQTTSYIDWMIPERIATTYWGITLSDGTVLNLVGSNGKSHRLYNITKQRFDYPQDFEPNDLALKEDGTTSHVISCREIEKTVRFYNIASHEHINVYANGVLTSNRLNNRYKIVDNKFTDEKVMTDKEVSDYRAYLETIKA